MPFPDACGPTRTVKSPKVKEARLTGPRFWISSFIRLTIGASGPSGF